MNRDIRIATSFFRHRKTLRLKKTLGLQGVVSLLTLWAYAAVSAPKGLFRHDEVEEMAIGAEWPGDPKLFIDTLIDIGFINSTRKGLQLHDWEVHNSYAFHADVRTEKAKKAAQYRWGRRDAGSNAGSMPGAMQVAYAPSPTPSPTPSPKDLKTLKPLEQVEKNDPLHTPKKRASKKQTNPAVKELIDLYHDLFVNRFGTKPVIQGGKDGEIIRTLLLSYPQEQLEQYLNAFFSSDDQFIQGSGYTLGAFKGCLNKLIVGKQAQPQSALIRAGIKFLQDNNHDQEKDHGDQGQEKICRGTDCPVVEF